MSSPSACTAPLLTGTACPHQQLVSTPLSRVPSCAPHRPQILHIPTMMQWTSPEDHEKRALLSAIRLLSGIQTIPKSCNPTPRTPNTAGILSFRPTMSICDSDLPLILYSIIQ
ncbi:hypothetical protein K505DRAFT_17759 [Melanomma pulvis-pyrius CBS 109.77]|uniref:Uncharacterized protein n=1 Tax=Melanomma pulvis-pyrius CBS 109.77 TaxID=1314802 RepID=A0A6A6XFZ6_9PLEO|nr:hypothetical protein K505DRAFT_17759 [Melanomma pulvis-pyrius CBS 109.77]